VKHEIYNQKLIISGNVLEFYVYENSIVRGYELNLGTRLGRSVEASDEDKQANRALVLSRAQKRVRRLINANRGHDTKFITLTFAENLQDLDKANLHFNRFIKRLRYRFGKFGWLVVPEFQKRGAVHYHMVTFGLGYVPNSVLRNIWGHGFVRINRCDDVTNLGAYVCKYMTKHSGVDKLQGRKSWWCSRGLKEPEEILDPEIIRTRLAGLVPSYVADFESEHLGAIHYEQYNILNSTLYQYAVTKSGVP
jgi:hypothetical protein